VEPESAKQAHVALKVTVVSDRDMSSLSTVRVPLYPASLPGLANPVGVWAAEPGVADVHDRMVAPASFGPAAVTRDTEPACDCLERTGLQGMSPLYLQLRPNGVTAALRGSGKTDCVPVLLGGMGNRPGGRRAHFRTTRGDG
jgi:hypothetical protein